MDPLQHVNECLNSLMLRLTKAGYSHHQGIRTQNQQRRIVMRFGQGELCI
jgi:hypothetical protein